MKISFRSQSCCGNRRFKDVQIGELFYHYGHRKYRQLCMKLEPSSWGDITTNTAIDLKSGCPVKIEPNSKVEPVDAEICINDM